MAVVADFLVLGQYGVAALFGTAAVVRWGVRRVYYRGAVLVRDFFDRIRQIEGHNGYTSCVTNLYLCCLTRRRQNQQFSLRAWLFPIL